MNNHVRFFWIAIALEMMLMGLAISKIITEITFIIGVILIGSFFIILETFLDKLEIKRTI
jgi:hypothetical protein